MSNFRILERPHREIANLFYQGSGKILYGQGVAATPRYGGGTAAATSDQKRGSYANALSITNSKWFAGWALETRRGVSGGQWVDVIIPGRPGMPSVFDALCLSNVTQGDRLNVLCNGPGAGRLWLPSGAKAGFPGPGCVEALETNSSVVVAQSSDGDGSAYITSDKNKLYDSESNIFDDVSVGDQVFLHGIEQDGTNSVTAAASSVRTVTAVDTSNNLVTLDEEVTDGGTMNCHYTIVSGNPTIRVRAVHGPYNGCVAAIFPNGVGGASETTTFTAMQSGKMYLLGGGDPSTGNVQASIAQANPGDRIGAEMVGAVAGMSNDYELRPATEGYDLQGAQTFHAAVFDADGESFTADFESHRWIVKDASSGVIENT